MPAVWRDSDKVHLNLQKPLCLGYGSMEGFVFGGGLPRFPRMPFMRGGVDAGEAGVGRCVEDPETLDGPLRGCFRCYQERGVECWIEPLGNGAPTVLCKKSRSIKSSRLGTCLAAQPFPPQWQDPGVAPLPRGRKRTTIPPVRHSTTLSRIGAQGLLVERTTRGSRVPGLPDRARPIPPLHPG